MLRRKLPHVWQPPTGFFYIYSLFPRIFPEMVPGSSSRNSADSRCNIRNLCERIRVGHGDSPFWKIKNASRTRFLRRVKQTRGTTQIAKMIFRHLFEVQQLLCTNVAYTGNAYWVINLWGFRLRRDRKFCCSLPGSHHPRLSEIPSRFRLHQRLCESLINLSILYHCTPSLSIQRIY